MENQLNSGSLDTLKNGDTLLASARKINGGKISLEFAEIIESSDRVVSALTILNKSDDRFSSRARRGWVSAEPGDAAEIFGVNFGDDGNWEMTERGETMELNILNPLYNEQRFRIQINETTEGTQWQIDNADVAAKRRGKGGEFITNEGNYIYSNADVNLFPVDAVVEHTYLKPDTQTISESKPKFENTPVEELNLL
tara:strand:+ start:2959 stop:3549 length:591 start_codon:yes stop_codon:yes gene_type:complete